MYRLTDGKIYGVLMDYDLSAWRTPPTSNHAPTPKVRWGTTLYMAHELLEDSFVPHLYRHEVESFFHTMLLLTTHNDFRAPLEGEHEWLHRRQGMKELPYDHWINPSSREVLSCSKCAFFTQVKGFDLSPTFKGFDRWMNALYLSLVKGYHSKYEHHSKVVHQRRMRKRRKNKSGDNKPIPEFDDETLGGNVSYSTLIDPVRELKGELEGLIIRYEGTTSVGA